MPSAQPAEAQSTVTIWSTTFTPEDKGGFPGCDQGCAGRFSPATFTYEGATYSFHQLDHSSGAVNLVFNSATANFPNALKHMTLHIGSLSFVLSEATIAGPILTKAQSTAPFSIGEPVSIRLTQPRDDWRSWNPTLTIQSIAAGNTVNKGCQNTDSDDAKKCSTAATLTDDDFVLRGRTFTVETFTVTPVSRNFTLILTAANASSLIRPLTLQVDGLQLAFPNASGLSQAGTSIFVTWNAVTLPSSWTAGDLEGQRMRLRLLPGPPGKPMDLSSDGRGDTSFIVTWTAPDTATTASVTGYEVDYKLTAAPDEASPDNDPAFGWVTKRVGRSASATISGLAAGAGEYHVRVRALSRSGPGPWSDVIRAAPGPAALTGTLPELKIRMLSASRTTVTEGASGQGTVTVTARCAHVPPCDPFHLSLSGTATKGSDYTISSEIVRFPEGQRTATVTITIINDAVDDSGETIHVKPAGIPTAGIPIDREYVIYPHSVEGITITILNDDPEQQTPPPDNNQGSNQGSQNTSPSDPLPAHVARYDTNADGIISRAEVAGPVTEALLAGEITNEEYAEILSYCAECQELPPASPDGGSQGGQEDPPPEPTPTPTPAPTPTPTPTPEPTPTPTPTPPPSDDDNDGECDGTLTLEDVLRAQEDFRAGRITEEELWEILHCWDEQRGV